MCKLSTTLLLYQAKWSVDQSGQQRIDGNSSKCRFSLATFTGTHKCRFPNFKHWTKVAKWIWISVMQEIQNALVGTNWPSEFWIFPLDNHFLHAIKKSENLGVRPLWSNKGILDFCITKLQIHLATLVHWPQVHWWVHSEWLWRSTPPGSHRTGQCHHSPPGRTHAQRQRIWLSRCRAQSGKERPIRAAGYLEKLEWHCRYVKSVTMDSFRPAKLFCV